MSEPMVSGPNGFIPLLDREISRSFYAVTLKLQFPNRLFHLDVDVASTGRKTFSGGSVSLRSIGNFLRRTGVDVCRGNKLACIVVVSCYYAE